MRRTSLALLALSAGLTASAALRRLAARRRSGAARAITPAAITPAAPASAPVAAPVSGSPAPAEDAVVLPFTRRQAGAPAERPVESQRCGDNGGRTKAGAPCAARATSAGRCHHHRVAA
jgi:hypothetical protein